MRRFKTTLFGSLTAVALAAGPALANSEVITAYDARSAGMGLTGSAFIGNAAATFHNPAGLTNIPHLDVTVHFSPGVTSSAVPSLTLGQGATAPSVINKQSDFILTPLAFVGVGYRLHPGVTVGLAAHLTHVKGVTFGDTGMGLVATDAATLPTLSALDGSAKAAQLFWEVRAPIAVDINKYITVAAGYRMGFYHELSDVKIAAAGPRPEITLRKSSYSGRNFAGAQAGILLRPTADLRIGLSYRSKLVLNGSGSLDQFNLATNSTVSPEAGRRSRYASPHMFTAGIAYTALNKRLLLAGDYKYWMYKDAYGGAAFRDAMSGHIGAEYMVTPRVPVRAGYLIGLSAVRKNLATPFDVSPGLQHGGSLGSGYHFSKVDLDGAVGFGGSATQVSEQTTAVNGKYKLYALLLHVSATVHL